MTEISPGDLYDNIINSDYTINYTSNNSTFGDTVYPENNMLSVFGPIYAPRIYGKDLSTFELASSGAIAITLQDAISLLMERNVDTSNVSFSTPVGDSFGIYTNDSNMYMTFDATTNNATLYAQNDALIDVDNNMSIQVNSNLTVTSTNLIGTFQNDITLTTVNDMVFNASNDVSVRGESNMFINAGSNISILAESGSLNLYSSGSNAYIKLDSSDDTMTLFSTNSISATSTNDINVYASSNVFITAENASLIMSANNSNVFVKLDATSNDLNVYSSNATTFDIGQNMTTSIGNDYSVSVGNDYTESASNNYSITATNGSFDISAKESAMTFSMNSTTLNTTIYSSNNFSATASNDMSLVTLKDMNISGSAGDNYITFDSSVKDTTIYASNNTYIDADTGTLSMNGGTSVQMSTDNDSYFTLSNNNSAYLNTGSTGSFNITAGTVGYDLSTSVNFTVGDTNILTIEQDKIVVRGNMDIEGTINTIDYNVTELHVEDRTINLAYNSNGDVVNDGTINTKSGIVVEGMPQITDVNIGQNIYTDAVYQPIYEKSIKWNYNDTDSVDGFIDNIGVGGIATSNIQSESYWEVKGGGLRLTAARPVFDENMNITGSNVISFGLRINEHDELEFVKKYMSGGSYVVKRVAKFGRTLVI